MNNILLATDVYKMGHMEQYCPGTTKVYSYLTTRSEQKFNGVMWFGLKYYLKKYLSQLITHEMGAEFLYYRESILGLPAADIHKKIHALASLGYWPLLIKALPEAETYPIGMPLLTITNTHPDFYWCVGFIESLLLKVWYPSTVATQSAQYRTIVEYFYEKTCSDEQMFLKDFAVHDFGYRGDSSEESANLSGGAHLLSFKGSDTVVAAKFMDTYYPEFGAKMFSVPATEHSVMSSFGKENEIKAFEHMLDLYPTGIVSIVSDTYDLWNVLSNFAPILRERILARDGKVVFRPDSGNPIDIICGIDEYDLGCLRLLDKIFGSTINSKGYKEINPKVGLIYGDGMYPERYQTILSKMKDMGYAASNLMIGVGGILRNHTRDTLGFAIKATYVEVNGEPRAIFKDPITDRSKSSLTGLIKVENGGIKENCSIDEEQEGDLEIVFRDGRYLGE